VVSACMAVGIKLHARARRSDAFIGARRKERILRIEHSRKHEFCWMGDFVPTQLISR
jgi:hypothetical protein